MLELDKIYNMDCLKAIKKLPDNSIDYIITDTPYNLNKDKWDIGVLDLLDNVAQECERVLKHDGILFWFIPTRYLFKIGFLISQYIQYRWTFVWNTPNNMIPGDMGFAKYTMILVFSKTKVFRNMQDLKSINWKPLKNNGHPTPKPRKLIRYLITKVTNENDIILDPFSGSGIIPAVCKELNRHYIAFEINQEYYNHSLKKLMNIPVKLEEFVNYNNKEV